MSHTNDPNFNEHTQDGTMSKEMKISLLKGLKRGYFERADFEILGAALGSGSLCSEVITAAEQIERYAEGYTEPQSHEPTLQRPFTREIKKMLLKGLKRGYFLDEEQTEIRHFLHTNETLTIILVKTREEVAELNRLEKLHGY